MADYFDKTRELEIVKGVLLNALPEQNLLWRKADEAGNVTKEALDSKIAVLSVVGHKVFVSEKGHLDWFEQSPLMVRKRNGYRKLLPIKLAAHESKINEVELRERLLTDSSAVLSDLKKQLAA